MGVLGGCGVQVALLLLMRATTRAIQRMREDAVFSDCLIIADL